MGFSGFIKLPRHRSFNYQPRYYDERKEKLDAKSKENDGKKILREDRLQISDYYFARKKYAKKQSLVRRVIVVVTMILLMAVVYMAFELYSRMN